MAKDIVYDLVYICTLALGKLWGSTRWTHATGTQDIYCVMFVLLDANQFL